MTGNALVRCALIYTVDVTFRTGQAGVFSDQWKTCIVMIECRISPAAGVVTRTAVRAELTIMIVSGRMTGITIRRCAFVDSIGMAGGAKHTYMTPGQREVRTVVIEGDICPLCGLMTRSTVRSKLTIVFIPRGMTGITIGRCSLVHPVDVASRTLYRGMSSR